MPSVEAEAGKKRRFKHELAVEDAALLVLEAMEGIHRAKPMPTVLARRCHHWAVALKPVSVSAVTGLIALTFFEWPQWCLQDPDACQDELHTFMFVPVEYAQAIELLLLLPLIVHQVMKAVAYRIQIPSLIVLDIAIAVYVVDLIVAVVTDHPGVRVAPYMRALLLVGYSSNLTDQLTLFRRIFSEFMSILSVIAMFLAFFAWFGNVTFAGEERAAFFPNFVEACWSLLVMLTTANFPDVMIPAFIKHRAVGLVFFPAVVVGVFVLMNFLLASTYDKYSNGHQELLDSMLRLREENCARAFDMLVAEGEEFIDPDIMEELLTEVNLCSGAGAAELDRLRADQRVLLFQLMDSDNDNGVSKSEFEAVITLLQLRFERVEPVTFVQLWFPETYYSGWFQRLCYVVKHPWFEYGVDAVLVLNAVVLVVESAEALEGDQDFDNGKEGSSPWMEAEGRTHGLNSWLGWVYVVEMCLKISVFGWGEYWDKNRNRFDGIITVGGVVTELLLSTTSIAKMFHIKGVMVYFVTFRLLRVARLMVAVPQLRIIITTFVNIAPEASQFLMLLFVCMFTFCVLGVQLYGGKVSSDPDSEINKGLLDTGYAENDYWPMNFNEMSSGMAVLFCLLVVNNWSMFVDVFVQASGGNKWHRWYFVMFYIIGVLVILNVVIAVVLENFMLQWTSRRERRKERMHFLEEHAHDEHEQGTGVRKATRPRGAQYKVKLASSVKMIEKDEVIKRFLNMEKHDPRRSAVAGEESKEADPLGTSLRRLLTVVNPDGRPASNDINIEGTIPEDGVSTTAAWSNSDVDERTILVNAGCSDSYSSTLGSSHGDGGGSAEC